MDFCYSLDKKTSSDSWLATSRAQKTHAYGVDIPEHDGEKITTLGGREAPEYRF